MVRIARSGPATPAAIVEQLSSEVRKALATPVLQDRTAQEGAKPVGSTPPEFERFLRDEIAKWTRIIRDLGLKLD
jgi:tripartite-type tricarboxylate transporter receptor subunit TctC